MNCGLCIKGDERCILDTMRLIDLLLVLLFEGRAALPKSAASASAAAASGRVTAALRRMDSAGEKTHRQLIDCIRSKVCVGFLVFLAHMYMIRLRHRVFFGPCTGPGSRKLLHRHTAEKKPAADACI